MNLSLSKLALASVLSFAACDTELPAVTPASLESSPAVTALTALGPERRITPTTADEARAMVETVYDSSEAEAALRRQRSVGFHFEMRATSTFWTKGDNGELGVVVQRGVRDDEQVLVTTLLRPDFTVVSTLVAEGEGADFTVFETADGEENEVPTPDDDDGLEVEEAALISYTTTGTSAMCQLQSGIIDAGGQIADGLCTGEAHFVCFWTHIGNDAAFKRCVNQRQAACAIGTNHWDAPTCR
ncbi:MAG TPA: hypothetical protein PK095_23225 [Myxococcota bacterium]|nr:hypothetical protein [Myxococcota bacterium]